jgi:hypothetical protein
MITNNAATVLLMPFFLLPRQQLHSANSKTLGDTAVISQWTNTVGITLQNLRDSGKIAKKKDQF